LIYFMEGSVMFDFCRPMMSPDKSLVLVLLIFTLKLLPSLFSTFEYATEFHLFSWTVFDRMLLFCSIEPTRVNVCTVELIPCSVFSSFLNETNSIMLVV